MGGGGVIGKSEKSSQNQLNHQNCFGVGVISGTTWPTEMTKCNSQLNFIPANLIHLYLTGGTYSLDQMSDDEDLDDVRPSGSGHPQQITASQLAAAFAAVTGSDSSPVSSLN